MEEVGSQIIGKAQTFSPEETKAISELKGRLSIILKKASEESKNTINDTLWGIKLDENSTDLRLSVILVKFLRARDLNIDNAATMLTNSLKWRAEFGADNLLAEEFSPEVFANVGYLHKVDKENRPVCYNRYGGLDVDSVFGDLNRFLRWRVQLMEKGIQKLDFIDIADMIQVHDYKGVGLFNYNKLTKAASKATIQIMQDNYPEFLAAKFFVNVPSWGAFIFKIVRTMLSEATQRKFVVCSTSVSDISHAMLQRVPKENLPKEYGGDSDTGFAPNPSVVSQPTEATSTVDDSTTSKQEETIVETKSNEESKTEISHNPEQTHHANGKMEDLD